MKQALKKATFAPNVLANALTHAQTGMNLPMLNSVKSDGAQNKTVEPEASDPLDVDRTSDTSEPLVGPVSPRVTDIQRLDAWLKLHLPSRNVPCSRKKFEVEQLTPDGELITLKVRKRIGGNLPIRTVAIGSGGSTAKVQILTPKVVAARQDRSNDNRKKVISSAGNVKMYVCPQADKEVLDQFKVDVEARQRMDRETLMACMLNSSKRHAEWQQKNGGSTTLQRHAELVFGNRGSAPVVEDKAANDSCISSDSNIEQFREGKVNGVQIGTAHPSNNKFKLINDNSSVAAQQKSTQFALEDRSAHAYQHRTHTVVCLMNTHALHNISALDNVEGHRYLAWLESHELDNPIIDSNRIHHGQWLDHMSVLHCSEQVKLMRRLNEASNYRKGKRANKILGLKISKGVGAHKVFENVYGKTVYKVEAPASVPEKVSPVREQSTSVPLIKQSSDYNEVFKLVTPTPSELAKYSNYGSYIPSVGQTLTEAINTNDLYVEISGVKTLVSKETMLKALLVA